MTRPFSGPGRYGVRFSFRMRVSATVVQASRATERSSGSGVPARLSADVTSVVLPDCGHYPAEEAPDAVLSALTTFLAPYRDGRQGRA
ncbi:alpha/beta fold hydrolase [Streptomyces lydicus]|uniref:alpha/beta fold hydrolase n=1 Tax=Streptomyces lydicus TaxID=47763 RepID=UPI00379680D5